MTSHSSALNDQRHSCGWQGSWASSLSFPVPTPPLGVIHQLPPKAPGAYKRCPSRRGWKAGPQGMYTLTPSRNKVSLHSQLLSIPAMKDGSLLTQVIGTSEPMPHPPWRERQTVSYRCVTCPCVPPCLPGSRDRRKEETLDLSREDLRREKAKT